MKNLTLKSALSDFETKAVSEYPTSFAIYFISPSFKLSAFSTTPAGFPPSILSVNDDNL